MHAQSPFRFAYSLLVLLAFTSACGASSPRGAMTAARPAATADEPIPLNRSLFARDTRGQLSEEALQAILARPLELELPARVGVLPIIAADDWRGPGPDYSMVSAGLARFSKELPSDEAFTLVSEIMPIPSGALGMEALREIAARYKLRYIVLYRENVERKRRVNPWALGYATLIGSLFLPGSTLSINGYVEASLFDVKTGLLMFTVRRRIEDSRVSNLWHRKHKLAKLQAKLAQGAGAKLAGDVRGALFQYKTAVALENQRTKENALSAPAAPDQAAEKTNEMPANIAGPAANQPSAMLP